MPEVGTRKRAREDDADSESDPANEDTKTPKKHRRSFKHSRITRVIPQPEVAGSDKESDEEQAIRLGVAPKKRGRPFKVVPDSEEAHAAAGSDGEPNREPEEHAVAPKKRGRPFKVVADSEETCATRSFNVPVYVEIAVPPKLKPGKTYKGNKMEKQEPRMEGPFTLTHKMSWGAFLTAISNTVDEDIENLVTEDMKWGIQRKGRYPLVNRVGYDAMHKQIVAQKDPSSLIIMVYLPMPRVPKRKGQRQDQDSEDVEQDNSRWAQKVGHIITRFITASYSRL